MKNRKTTPVELFLPDFPLTAWKIQIVPTLMGLSYPLPQPAGREKAAGDEQ